MAPSPLDKQPAGYKSPHDWLVMLGMDLAVLCVTYVEPKLAPTDAIWLFSVQMYPLPATLWLPATPHPIGVLVVLA